MLLDNVPSDSDSLHQRNGHYNPLVLASGWDARHGARSRSQSWNVPRLAPSFRWP
ncbi:hypothetical protein GMO_01060 [Gluconobacter morbifer G707]|uniref:Uncharacterized protein n=1 Tax=Gluconobacter morbifer G707 TaxID=1088869 RepID=G6XF41_9PROT|nr:hypothetical protein GMO_01060 [Gluconobacter morbifer G707]